MKLYQQPRYAGPDTIRHKTQEWLGGDAVVDVDRLHSQGIEHDCELIDQTALRGLSSKEAAYGKQIAADSAELDRERADVITRLAGDGHSLLSKLAVTAGLKPSRDEFSRQLQIEEARIGSLLFGDVPAGRHREFYQQDAKTWVWNEMTPRGGSYESHRTEYRVLPFAVVKTSREHGSEALRGDELANFSLAVGEYSRRTKSHFSQLKHHRRHAFSKAA